jgi:hypothetical protein
MESRINLVVECTPKEVVSIAVNIIYRASDKTDVSVYTDNV